MQNHLQEALPYYQRALTAFRRKKDRNGEATALVRIAIVMERQDKHEEALRFLSDATAVLERCLAAPEEKPQKESKEAILALDSQLRATWNAL